MCICFSCIAHPCLSIDTLSKTYLKILYELCHHLLRRLWEETLRIHTAKSFAHLCFYLICSTLPKRIILFTATHCLTKEIEVCFTDFIRKIASTVLNNIPLHKSLDLVGCLQRHQLVKTSHKCRLTNNH